MEASFQIVGCVLASRPAADLIDAFCAQARRERAAVLSKSAQAATFVRFGARDAALVTLACQALRGAGALRFGFVLGTKESLPGPAPEGGEDGLHIGTRSVVQASELAAAASDGEVLVSPQLAVMLIEAGVALRSRRLTLPGGRELVACVLDTATAVRPAAATSPASVPSAAMPLARHEPGEAALLQKADAVGTVLRTLMAQADEMARRQGELEARQDAVLGKMTLVDTGSPSTRHLAELEAELDGQLERVQARLGFIEQLERRVGDMQVVGTEVERGLGEQVPRLAEIDNFRVLSDTLLARLVDAQERLDGVASLQERLLPLGAQVSALADSAARSEQLLAGFEQRLQAMDHGTEAVLRQMQDVAEREVAVQRVKAGLDEIRALADGNRVDLAHVSAQRAELAELRTKVDRLLGAAADADEKIATIEARRAVVDEVQASTRTVTHMLGDIELHMDLLGEQRAVVDLVGEKVARLDFSLQEAQNTLRALQREREVAERIEQGIKALRARGAALHSG